MWAAIHDRQAQQNQRVLPLLEGAEAMSKNQRRSSVALDEESYQISKRVGNFSAFVRECLRRWNAHDLGEHIQPERADIPLGKKCFPRLRKGCCVLCWPDGPPRQEDWSYYCETGGRVVVGKRIDQSPIFETRTYNNSWIEEKAREANQIPEFSIPTDSRFSYSRKSPETLGVLAKVANFLRAKVQRSR